MGGLKDSDRVTLTYMINNDQYLRTSEKLIASSIPGKDKAMS